MYNVQSPDRSDQGTERLIKNVGADKAPRVTPAALQAEIREIYFFTGIDGVVGSRLSKLYPEEPMPVRCPNEAQHSSARVDGSSATTLRKGTGFKCLHASCQHLPPDTLPTDALTISLQTPDYTALSLMTFCVIVMRNGFTVHGVSSCASPENYNERVGREVAQANAENAMWPLMGYALKEKLWQDQVNEKLVENLKGAKPCKS